MKIGKIKLKNPFILAPLAGITNVAFRILCRKYGASLAFSEMVSAEALIRENSETGILLQTAKEDNPLSVQLFGADAVVMKEAAKIIEKMKICDIIDINLGCPAQDIIRTGAGAALLKNPKKAGELVAAVVDSVNLPVTAKIRIGYGKKINALSIAEILQEAGIKALTVHGRTLSQGYRGKADWDIIKNVKEKLHIPVIGNGDISHPTQPDYYIKDGYCDAVMIGRAAIGYPRIFQKMLYFQSTGEILEENPKDRISDFFEYLKLAKKYELDNVSSLRMQAQHFTKGLYDSTTLRAGLNNVKTSKDIETELKKYLLS